MEKKILAILILFTFLGCPRKRPKEVIPKPQDAYQILKEDELERLIRVMPKAKVIFEEEGKRFPKLSPAKDVLTGMRNFMVASKAIKNLDKRMRKAGMPLVDFYSALYKTTAAYTAVLWDSSMATMQKEFEKQKREKEKIKRELEKSGIPELQRKMMETALKTMENMQPMFEKTRKLFSAVPDENKRLIKKHWKEVEEIFK